MHRRTRGELPRAQAHVSPVGFSTGDRCSWGGGGGPRSLFSHIFREALWHKRSALKLPGHTQDGNGPTTPPTAHPGAGAGETLRRDVHHSVAPPPRAASTNRPRAGRGQGQGRSLLLSQQRPGSLRRGRPRRVRALAPLASGSSPGRREAGVAGAREEDGVSQEPAASRLPHWLPLAVKRCQVGVTHARVGASPRWSWTEDACALELGGGRSDGRRGFRPCAWSYRPLGRDYLRV